MFTASQYVRVQSLEQAYQLNQKRSATIIAGGGWLRLGKRNIGTLIDLCDLKLDTITETADDFVLGAMVTLHTLETSDVLQASFGEYFRRMVAGIVGVQFRNMATIGGSVVGRFGFSDVLTGLLALDCDVELMSRGRISLEEYAALRPDKDILTHVYIGKNLRRAVHYSQRNNATDIPVLSVAMSVLDGQVKAVVGARPSRGAVVPHPLMITASDAEQKAFIEQTQQTMTFGSNMRGSATYRRHLCGVLINRCLNDLR